MLLSSSRGRRGPETGALSLHLQETAGADVAYTCKPSFIADLMAREHELDAFDPGAIDSARFPRPPLDKLLRLPCFAAAYDPDGCRGGTLVQLRGALQSYDLRRGRAQHARLVDFVSAAMRRHEP